MFATCWHWLDLGLKSIMAIFLFAMMALTAADVVGRYVLNAPIPGAFELVQYMMAIVVFAALPLTTAVDGHLSVSLIPTTLRGPIGRAHRMVIRLISAIALLLIAWRTASEAQTLASSQQVSGYLQLPLAPIAAAMAGFASLAFLIILVRLVGLVLGYDKPGLSVQSAEPEYE